MAMSILGKGDGLTYLQDDAEAVRWYSRAAEQGHARAQSELGEMYANGRGVEHNDAEAVSVPLGRNAMNPHRNPSLIWMYDFTSIRL